MRISLVLSIVVLTMGTGNARGEEWDWRSVFDRPYLLVQKTTNIYSGELVFKDRREVGVLEPLASAEKEIVEGRVYYRTEGGYLILAGGVEQDALWERNGVVVMLPEKGELVRALVRELCGDRVFVRPAPGWDEEVRGERTLEPYAWVRVRYVAQDRERVFAYAESDEGEGWVFMNSLRFGVLEGSGATVDGASGQMGDDSADFDWTEEASFFGVAIEEMAERERIRLVFEVYNRGVRAAKGYYEMVYGRSVPVRTLGHAAEESDRGWRIAVSVDEGNMALEAEKELYRTLRQVLEGEVVIVPSDGGQGF